jgi:hypothetical protein
MLFPGFFDFVRQYGWDKYVEIFSRHNKYFEHTNWEKDLFFLVLTFTGPTDCGHFTALVVDRTQYEDGVLVFRFVSWRNRGK